MAGFDGEVDEKRIRDSIAARMPLERPEKPVQTFSGGGSYPTTSEGVKRISELLIESMEEGLKNNPNSTGKWSYEYKQY